MDFGSTLVGLGTLFVFMAPVYWLIQSGKRSKLKRIKIFKEYASRLGSEVGEVACWSNNYCLATDTTGTAVFYSNGHDPLQPFHKIDLSNKSSCKVVTDARKLKKEKETIQVIDRIQLRFEFKNAKIAPEQIILFDTDTDPSITDQMVLAEKWQKQISELLRKR